MGKKSREKGAVFERLIVRVMTKALGAQARRTQQAHRPFEPDVGVEGPELPDWLTGLWVECQHANAARPAKKLAQAERDAQAAQARAGGALRLPVVVWRQTGERSIWATLRVGTLDRLRGARKLRAEAELGDEILATVDLDDLLSAIRVRLDECRTTTTSAA